MADGVPPYIDHSTAEAIVLITNLNEAPPCFKDPGKWSSGLVSFLGLCLTKQTHNRPSARDLLKVREEREKEEGLKKGEGMRLIVS
jgi:hypothetical protein